MRRDDHATTHAAVGWAWGLLAARPLLLLASQGVVVLGLARAGVAEPWWASAPWWPVAATAANLVGLALLAWRLGVEGSGWRRDRVAGTRGPGAPLLLATFTIVGAAGALPALWIARALWADPSVGQAMMVGPLPSWAAWVSLLLFPLTTAAVELPTFAGYVLPRLRAAGLPVALVVVVAGTVLGVQHGVLPLLPASQFFLWRVTMFLPVALLTVALLAWRPRLLPWLVGAQFAVGAVVGYQVLMASI